MPDNTNSTNQNLDDILKQLEEKFGSGSQDAHRVDSHFIPTPHASSRKSGQTSKKRSSVTAKFVVGTLALMVAVIGGASAMFLSQQDTELRQQAQTSVQRMCCKDANPADDSNCNTSLCTQNRDYKNQADACPGGVNSEGFCAADGTWRCGSDFPYANACGASGGGVEGPCRYPSITAAKSTLVVGESTTVTYSVFATTNSNHISKVYWRTNDVTILERAQSFINTCCGWNYDRKNFTTSVTALKVGRTDITGSVEVSNEEGKHYCRISTFINVVEAAPTSTPTPVPTAVPTAAPTATPQATPPPAPTGLQVTGLPACVTETYTANLSWSGTRNSGYGFIVDISKNSNFSAVWNKTVGSGFTTTAPTGFTPYNTTGTLVLEAGVTYYSRVYNGAHSNTISWNVPRCATPVPTASPTPVATPRPTPSNVQVGTLPACSNQAYTTTISWSGPAADFGFFIDISTASTFATYWNKQVPSGTSTAAPAGFTSTNQTNPLTLQPGTTYYTRVYNVAHSSIVSWSVPRCATPAPTPTATPAPVCASISMNNPNGSGTNAPKLGDTVTFTCAQVAGITNYQFRVKLPNGSLQTVSPAASGSRVSQPFTISISGSHTAQCRICSGTTDSSCQAWE